MTLYVHRAERADQLVAALAELMAEPLSDPFTDEVISVPARGVERWLTQQLSRRLGQRSGRADGICAGVRFPPPAVLLTELRGGRESDPWAPDGLVWPLLEVIDESLGEPWFETVSVAAPPVPSPSEMRLGSTVAVDRIASSMSSMPAPCR